VPYVPFTAYGLAAPLPAKCELHFGEPLTFAGTGAEEDSVIRKNVEEVKSTIGSLIDAAKTARAGGAS
jgi:hypothetical protein